MSRRAFPVPVTSLLSSIVMLAAMAKMPAHAATIAVPVEHWSGANQSAGGLVTGNATFAQGSYLKLPSQTLVLRSVKLMPFPANLGFASGNVAHLYRIVSGGTSVLPGGNYLCGGAQRGATPTFLLVTHYTNTYAPGHRNIDVGIYSGSALPTGASTDALCATVGYVAS